MPHPDQEQDGGVFVAPPPPPTIGVSVGPPGVSVAPTWHTFHMQLCPRGHAGPHTVPSTGSVPQFIP